jgi:hypothetical protein
MEGYQAAVLWGFVTSCQEIIKNCKAQGIPFVFMDLAYWARDKGYFKVSVNDRHPTDYFMLQSKPDDRFRKFGLSIKPWQQLSPSSYVLLAGMSGKAAWAWGMQNEVYERDTIRILRQFTQRPIIYRPKPSWPDATNLPGAKLDKVTPLSNAIRGAHCVVTHHSNVGCDALLEGIPVLSKYGIASVLGPHDLGSVEHPYYPAGREQWAYNAAYCQWSLDEMANGACWNHLKETGLVK